MAEAAEEVSGVHWMEALKEEKDVSDPDNNDAAPKKIFERLTKELENDYKNNDSKVNDIPIWFACEITKSAVKLHSWGNSLESLKQIAHHKKVLVAWMVCRCHDVDQQLRTKIVKVSFKGQGLGVKGRALFSKADSFVRNSEISINLDENLFVDTADYEYSGRTPEALFKEIKKNAGAHGAKKFYLGPDENHKFSD